MRFSTYINSQKCIEWGLNANQGALFDLLNQAASWAKEIIIDDVVYYWVSRNAVIEELPLFYSKPDTVYRHFSELHKKGLIVYQKHGEKDLIRLTEKGKTWNEFSSDLNPTLGNKSESARKQIRKSSDLNPTNNNTNYKNTNDHNNTLQPKTAATSPKRKYIFSEVDMRLAKDIFAKIKKLNPNHKEPIFEAWANDVRLLSEIDGKNHAEIFELFSWANQDSFWQTNILSPRKLREKWDVLTLQRGRKKPQRGDNMQAEWNTPEAWAEVL
ncbi:hypothetical protein PTQ27_09205 [Mannheimia sp. AT1]|uniref:Uncharacterized protein n=1 Tax=Mannheimia cairinae TaxID=3025936 RepID=A0ABT5MT02_9PAST|nr:hypothetical protein [Mannheimia cairinae]MDD0824634.1 hypothetical protein [Mannheimia cairinae]MDD0826437.1 hypothetical protein [Mannheimia cairinae]